VITQLRSENPPPEKPITRGKGSQLLPPKRVSSGRLVLAFILAALADGLSIFWALTPPVQWATDLVTAISLFIVLGWQWILLPGLIMEAIPGAYIFPFWLLVVAAVAMWGTARPKLKSRGHTSE
jgi:hypothetical protein